MILYPAIDLKDGKAVRLLRGDMDKATVFNDDPAAQALEFVAQGCEWLHLVDLNGAFAGEPVNAAPVEAILAATKVPAQLGGGIRDMATIEMWLGKGLSRVILGTVAVERPELVREAARAFPGQVAVGIDARNGRVATKVAPVRNHGAHSKTEGEKCLAECGVEYANVEETGQVRSHVIIETNLCAWEGRCAHSQNEEQDDQRRHKRFSCSFDPSTYTA